MIIKFHKQFDKSFQILRRQVKEKFYIRLKIFEKNPFDPILDNHGLKWNFEGKRSIDITWDYRAIFIEKSDWKYEFVEFVNVWTHSQIYG